MRPFHRRRSNRHHKPRIYNSAPVYTKEDARRDWVVGVVFTIASLLVLVAMVVITIWMVKK